MLDLSSLAAGDRVQHELVVRGREDKTTKNGDPFAVLQLGNATGAISANVWKEQLPWIEGVRAGSVVQVIGAVEHYQGGRQLHVVEVGTIVRGAARTMHADVDLVTAGALLHDIGKVEAYAISAAGFENSEAGYLVQHVVLGSIMLDRRLRTLPEGTLTDAQALELHHFIQSHHGLPEHGAAVRPMTLEAELLHWADQMSANGNNFLEAVEDPELFPGDEEFSVRKSWRLDRRVWRRPHQWD